jgi:hypothetical protein
VIDVRLINADALIDDLKHDVAADQDSLDYEELTDSNRKIIQFDKDCKQNTIDLLQNAPAIEPERKTGKWIDGYKRQTCSVCKQKGYRSWNFCPNCGSYNGGAE